MLTETHITQPLLAHRAGQRGFIQTPRSFARPGRRRFSHADTPSSVPRAGSPGADACVGGRPNRCHNNPAHTPRRVQRMDSCSPRICNAWPDETGGSGSCCFQVIPLPTTEFDSPPVKAARITAPPTKMQYAPLSLIGIPEDQDAHSTALRINPKIKDRASKRPNPHPRLTIVRRRFCAHRSSVRSLWRSDISTARARGWP